MSAIAQAVFSFLYTGYVSWLLFYLFEKQAAKVRKIIVPAIIVTVQTVLILSLLHTLIGTDKVFFTVLGPALVGFVYGIVMCYLREVETSNSSKLQ